jgi:hypothetical protein
MSELLATSEVYSCWQSKRKEHDAGEEICRSEEKEILNTSVMHGARVKGLPGLSRVVTPEPTHRECKRVLNQPAYCA